MVREKYQITAKDVRAAFEDNRDMVLRYFKEHMPLVNVFFSRPPPPLAAEPDPEAHIAEFHVIEFRLEVGRDAPGGPKLYRIIGKADGIDNVVVERGEA